MLLELNIENFAIIENMNIEFEGGLNVITGETGSGKSIIIDGLGMLLGDRASKDVINTGKDFCHIEGIFSSNDENLFNLLKEMGLEISDPIIISKDIKTKGPAITRINSKAVTAQSLNKIRPYLIDIFAQHESMDLMRNESQKRLLDSFGDKSHRENLIKLKSLVEEINLLKSDYEKNNRDSQNKNREIDLLNYQIDEIEKAELTDYDEDNLEEDFLKEDNITNTISSLARALEILKSSYSDFNVEDGIDKAIGEISDVIKFDGELKAYEEELEDIKYRLKDLTGELESHVNSLETDGERLEFLRDRLNLVNSLKSKYGKNLNEINLFLENSQQRLDFLINSEKYLINLKKEIDEKESLAQKISEKISENRKKFAESLTKKLNEEIKELNIKNAAFRIDFKKKDLSFDGFDHVEFMISSNLGQAFAPLAKIASGGEMSRIMLAFKSIIASKDDIPTLIFDEIDAGISGKTAQIVGNKIKRLAKDRQIIVISHLPQIVALSDCHFLIEKEVVENKTRSKIKKLSIDEKVVELAKLIAGENIGGAALDAAKEMIGVNKNVTD